ncbi:Predicted ATPase [Arachnia propionica]|nr:Predicted ATPase [Arachnia propionica]
MSMPPTDPESPNPSGHPRYSVFVSYSRRDDAGEWVKRLVEALRDAASDDFDVHFDPDKEVFFDRDDLRLGRNWKTQLARAIREAEVLLVCVSKPYFESDFCLWEFQEHETKPTGPDDPPGLIPLLLEDTARDDQPDEEHQRWHDRIHQIQAHDLRKLFTRMAMAAVPEELAAQVQVLSDELYQQKQEHRRKTAAIGNLTRGTSRFVGRTRELTQLGDALESPSTVGVVTAVRGLGGIGKTELVRHYGNRHRGHYAGGIWQIPAEGAREMLPLLARLASDLPGLLLPEEAQGNPELTGRHVLMELRRQAADSHVLLILDNVSEPALLTDPQLGALPEDNSLHVAVTTRLGSEDFAGSTRLKQIHLQGLSIKESVSLLRAFQPDRDGDNSPDFRDEDDLAAARELAELLDGFTLAVEQAGVYLSTHPEDTVRDYLNHLRSQNLTASDAMLDDDSKTRIEHREKLLSVILDQSLTDLEHTLPGSLQVLRLAAVMPPDTIPWPWLEELTKRTNPEVFEPTPQFLKGRWTRIRRTLEGRDLITEGRHPGATGRMHRLIADHIKTHNPPETDLVNAFIIQRAHELGTDFTQALELWEIDSITDALPDILTRKPELLEQIPDFIRHVALRYVTDTRITAMLQNLARRLSNINIQTRYLTHVLLGDSLRNVEPIKASESYKKSLNTIRDLAKDSPDDPWILQNLAVSLDNTSDMLHSTDPERALKQYRESLSIRRDLAKVRSGDLRIKRGIAISLSNIADIVRNTDPEQALTLYQESLTILRDLAETQPSDLRTRRDLTVSLDNMANILSNINPEQALGLYRESLAIRRDLTKTQPGDFLTLRDLTISLNNVADTLEHSDPGQALELYRESLAITRTIAEARPNDLEILRDLGLSLNNVSSMLCSGDHEQSLELYQKSLNIARGLLEARSGDPLSRRDLTVSLENFAYMLKNTDPEQALSFYQESLTIRRGLAETQPDNLLALRDLTKSLNGVGDMLRDTYPEQALSLYQEALTTARRLAERLPGNIQAQRDLTIPLDNVADMLSSIDHEQALKLYQESLVITRNLTKQLPDNLQAKRDLADSLHRVAHMLENSDPRQALNLHRESLLLTRSLAEQLPGDLEAQRDLALSLCNVAYMLENSDPRQALNLHRESLVIARRLVETRSDNLQAKRDLTVSLNNVAGMLHSSDPRQALNLYRESLIIASFLAERLPGNLQALWDLGISAVRLAQLLPTKDPEQVSLLREAAISFRGALAIKPEHQELGDLSYHVALYYACCDPDDRDEWFTYADELAERFGFEED